MKKSFRGRGDHNGKGYRRKRRSGSRGYQRDRDIGRENNCSEYYNLELPEGFEERTKDHGVVWKTWAPQLKILAHGAIGGCMSHCGSGSVIEKLHFVTLPYLLDQCLFSRALVEKKVVVKVTRSEQDGSFTRDSVAHILKLPIVYEEGSIYRANAKEMGKVFSSEDLYNQYIEDFIAALQKYRVTSNS